MNLRKQKLLKETENQYLEAQEANIESGVFWRWGKEVEEGGNVSRPFGPKELKPPYPCAPAQPAPPGLPS